MEGLDIAGAVLPGGGLVGAVLALLMWFGRVTREDRADYRVQLAAERHRIAELDLAADTEMGELRRRVEAAQGLADTERERRRDSDIAVEKLKVRVVSAEARTDWLTQELGRRGSLGYPPYPQSPPVEAL